MTLKIAAHRGGTSNPKYANQLETFLESAAEAWEIDLHMTKDEVILLHDNTLRNRVVAYGLEGALSEEDLALLDDDVSQLTLAQIRKLTGGHINTLDELLLAARSKGVDLLLEIKGTNTAIVKKLKERLSDFDSPNIFFICFCVAVIKELKESGFSNRVFLLTRATLLTDGDIRLRDLDDLNKVTDIIRENKLEGVGVEYAGNDKDVCQIVANLRASHPNIQIQFWVHQENETDRLFELAEKLGVEYCNSDHPQERMAKLKATKAK